MFAKAFRSVTFLIVALATFALAAQAASAAPLFGAKIDFPTGPAPLSVTTADFNKDNNPDMATANYGGSVSVLLGDGSGGFAGKTDFPVGVFPHSVTTADFNNDNNPDLAVANAGSDTVSVLLGDGSGGFAPKTDFPTGLTPASVTTADFNNDNKPDLAAGNYFSYTVSVLLAYSRSDPVAAPTSLSFSSQALGTLSSAQTLTISNSGDARLFVDRVRNNRERPKRLQRQRR